MTKTRLVVALMIAVPAASWLARTLSSVGPKPPTGTIEFSPWNGLEDGLVETGAAWPIRRRETSVAAEVRSADPVLRGLWCGTGFVGEERSPPQDFDSSVPEDAFIRIRITDDPGWSALLAALERASTLRERAVLVRVFLEERARFVSRTDLAAYAEELAAREPDEVLADRLRAGASASAATDPRPSDRR